MSKKLSSYGTDGSGNLKLSTGGASLGTSSGALSVISADSEAVHIDASQNVGIGISDPAANLEVGGTFSLDAPTELTVASGVVTATKSYHTVDTESNDPTDDLDTINGGVAGMLLHLRSAASSRDVTVKDATGNIQMSGDRVLNDLDSGLTLIFDGSNWREVAYIP